MVLHLHSFNFTDGDCLILRNQACMQADNALSDIRCKCWTCLRNWTRAVVFQLIRCHRRDKIGQRFWIAALRSSLAWPPSLHILPIRIWVACSSMRPLPDSLLLDIPKLGQCMHRRERNECIANLFNAAKEQEQQRINIFISGYVGVAQILI